MKQGLTLSKHHWQEMLKHVDTHAPLEACGLLAGKDARVENVILIRNQSQSRLRFVMDPYEQLRAFDWIESHHLDLVGIFHSHPTGPEAVSPTDIAEAAYPVVHVILARKNGEWHARGFWIENGVSQEVSLELIS